MQSYSGSKSRCVYRDNSDSYHCVYSSKDTLCCRADSDRRAFELIQFPFLLRADSVDIHEEISRDEITPDVFVRGERAAGGLRGNRH